MKIPMILWVTGSVLFILVLRALCCLSLGYGLSVAYPWVTGSVLFILGLRALCCLPLGYGLCVVPPGLIISVRRGDQLNTWWEPQALERGISLPLPHRLFKGASS